MTVGIACVKELLTVAHQGFHKIGVRRNVIHPFPPPELSEWLQHTVTVPAMSAAEKRKRGVEGGTHKINTSENDEVNANEAISIVGAIAATACPTVV